MLNKDLNFIEMKNKQKCWFHVGSNILLFQFFSGCDVQSPKIFEMTQDLDFDFLQ